MKPRGAAPLVERKRSGPVPPRAEAPREEPPRAEPPRREPPRGEAPRGPAPQGDGRPPGPRGSTRDRDSEIRVCGRHACRALFERRAPQILRVYILSELVDAFGDLLHALAGMRKPYKLVAADELERITESTHHEGICIVAQAPTPRALGEILAEPGPGWLVALAGVANPHNTGAIVRTAAHFGARAVLVEGEVRRQPPAVYRTAQGGVEWVDVLSARALTGALAEARRAGFTVCATSSHGGTDLYAAKVPARAVVLLGAEDEGLAPALAGQADLTLNIPGSGHVESLNVAAACAVLLAEVWRRHARS